MDTGRVLYVGTETGGGRGADALDAAGLRVLRATSGLDALKRLEDVDVDAVVCEVRPPDMSLVGLITATRAERPSVPVFVVGSPDGSEGIDRALPTESVAYFDAIDDKVVARIQTAVAERRTEVELARHRRLKDLVRELAVSFGHTSTRDEVERALYHRLSGVDLYRFVWVGRLDAASGVIHLRQPVEHDIDAADLTAVFGCEDPAFIEEAVTNGVLRTAVGSSAFRRPSAADVLDVPALNERPNGHGSFTCIAVPFAFEGTVHGFLLLAVDRSAVDESERAVLDGLGTLTGSAIGSTGEMDRE